MHQAIVPLSLSVCDDRALASSTEANQLTFCRRQERICDLCSRPAFAVDVSHASSGARRSDLDVKGKITRGTRP